MKDITDITPTTITIRPKWNAIFKHGRHSARHQMLNRNLAYEQALYNKPFEACTEKELFHRKGIDYKNVDLQRLLYPDAY